MKGFFILLSLGMLGILPSALCGAEAERPAVAQVAEPEEEEAGIVPSTLADPAPSPGMTPEATAQALYGTKSFLHLRGRFDREVVDHFQACFTSSLKAHLYLHSDALEAWISKHQDEDLKLPLTEGSIFISCYEGCTTYKVGRAVVKGPVARVPVVMKHFEQGVPYAWVDMAIFHREGNLWRLDEIVFRAGERESTLRDRLSFSPEEVEELLGKPYPPVAAE